jgi:Ca-activated chloride channel family protein
MFGQLLRDSAYKGDASYAKVIELARKGLDNDPNGYRREFIRLAEAVQQHEK